MMTLPPKTIGPVQEAAVEVLQQGETMLLSVTADHYRAELPAVRQASIGKHYRHCLDHFQTVLDAQDNPQLDYDARERDPGIENDRELARQRTNRLLERVRVLPPETLGRSILVYGKLGYATARASAVPSTIGRELLYAVTHAIHHYALIGFIGGLLGAAFPEPFGVAPSTVRHRQKTAAGSG